jgi:hypothetical protein
MHRNGWKDSKEGRQVLLMTCILGSHKFKRVEVTDKNDNIWRNLHLHSQRGGCIIPMKCKQGRLCTYNLTLRRIHETIAAVKNQ